MTSHEAVDLGDVVLQCGITLRAVTVAYKTYGTLNRHRDNAVVMPTPFGCHHTDIEQMLASGRALDPDRWFIIVPNMLGGGLSSSPSNTPTPFDRAAFPPVTVYDNIACQHRLVTEHLGIERLRLVVGFSMGAQQAFHWGALHADMVDAVAPICGSARTSPFNNVLLEGVKAALTADGAFDHGWYQTPPTVGLRAFSQVYGSLVLARDFLAEGEYSKLGLASTADVMRFLEGFFRRSDANDLLAMLETWQHADISANDTYRGDLPAALGGIKARAILLPSATDLLFPVADNLADAAHMPNADVRPIPSGWGHLAGFGVNPADNEFIDAALNELLAD